MARSQTTQDSQDHPMPDAQPAASNVQQPQDDDDNMEYGIRLLPGTLKDAASYEFSNEDHTLGNALRHMISKNPDVEFCGYSIPHPAEAKMNLRIQTYDGIDTQKVLEKGLDDLIALCDTTLEKFEKAVDDFENGNQV